MGIPRSTALLLALVLVAAVVRVENPVDLGDAHIPEMVEDLAGSEVDEHATALVPKYVNVAGVFKYKQVVGDLPWRARGDAAS